MCSINPGRPTGGGQPVNWVRPEGHPEQDDAPLQPRVYCQACDDFYDVEDVTAYGREREPEVLHA